MNMIIYASAIFAVLQVVACCKGKDSCGRKYNRPYYDDCCCDDYCCDDWGYPAGRPCFGPPPCGPFCGPPQCFDFDCCEPKCLKKYIIEEECGCPKPCKPICCKPPCKKPCKSECKTKCYDDCYSPCSYPNRKSYERVILDDDCCRSKPVCSPCPYPSSYPSCLPQPTCGFPPQQGCYPQPCCSYPPQPNCGYMGGCGSPCNSYYNDPCCY